MRKFFVGVDNGLDGAVVVIDEAENVVLKFVMPVTKAKKGRVFDVFELAKTLHTDLIMGYGNDDVYVGIEKAQVFPISGKRSCFMTGFAYGMIQGIFAALGLGYELITPKSWQKSIFEGLNQDDTKVASVLFCKRKWPDTEWRATVKSRKEHDGLTDAACIALYLKRKHNESKTA